MMASSRQQDARVAPAAQRNQQPIKEVLVEMFAGTSPGTILELACGTGQHAAFFSSHLPEHTWLPSDVTDANFGSVLAHTGDLDNVQEPCVLDASAAPSTWPVSGGSCAGVYCCNMTHIAPIEATEGLVAGAGEVLRPGGLLCIYGPFMVDGKCTTPSNQAFHESLQSQDARWGYRDITLLGSLAENAGLLMEEAREMPANNFFLLFRKPLLAE